MSYVLDGRCRVVGEKVIHTPWVRQLSRTTHHTVVRAAHALYQYRHGGRHVHSAGEYWDHGGYMMAVFHAVEEALKACRYHRVSQASTMVIRVLVRVEDVVLKAKPYASMADTYEADAKLRSTDVSEFVVWDSKNGWRLPPESLIEHIRDHATLRPETIQWALGVVGDTVAWMDSEQARMDYDRRRASS